MIKNLLILLFITGAKILNAQNLVLNPSFEDTVSCPNQINQVNRAAGWSSWAVTPDYFHDCANSTAPNFGVPFNNRGFQIAHTGNAYAGLFTRAILTPNSREYIGGSLSTPLTPGNLYYVSFWVNHADTSILNIATNNIGLRFTTSAYNSFVFSDTLNNSPHIFTNNIITDTLNWVEVQGSFVADSVYTHFGIGNYFSDALTNSVILGGGLGGNYSYYLIDDVCVSAFAGDCISKTAVNEMNYNKPITIMPNPFKQSFKLTSNFGLHNSKITIYDYSGNVLFISAGGQGNETEIETSDLMDSGIYFLEVSSDKGKYLSKIIKL